MRRLADILLAFGIGVLVGAVVACGEEKPDVDDFCDDMFERYPRLWEDLAQMSATDDATTTTLPDDITASWSHLIQQRANEGAERWGEL